MNLEQILRDKSLEDVIEEYSMATPQGNDLDILAKFSERYPEFSADLVEFASDREMLDFDGPAELTLTETTLFSRIGRDVHREMSAKRSAAPISSLVALAERRGLRRPDLAARLGITVSLVQYVEKRRLEFSSIPAKFIERVADAVGTSADAVAVYLQRGPEMRPAASFKAMSRPTDVAPRSFSEVVGEDPGLSPEQKRELLNL